MKTEIEFLDLLEEDLQIVAEIELEDSAPRLARVRVSRRVLVALAAVFIAVAGFVGYAVRGNGGGPQLRLAISSPAPRGPSSHGPVPQSADAGTVKGSDGQQGYIFGSQLTEGRDIGAPVAVPSPAPGAQGPGNSPAIGPKIVKTAELDVQVNRGAFDQAFREVSLIADRYGGYVASSSMGESTVREGHVTIRVPAKNFSRAVVDLAALGKTIQERINGEDVTADYVDLQGRIRTWMAQESVLLRLMSRADSIDETLIVQRHLQDVQLQIEHLKGQFRVLRDQVADGTISISLREPPRKQQMHSEPISPGFSDTWRKAARGFLDVVASVAIGLAYLIPISLIGLGIWLMSRRARSRLRA